MYKTITLKTLFITPEALNLPKGARLSNTKPEENSIVFNGQIDFRTDLSKFSQTTIDRMQKDNKGLISYKGKLFQYAYIPSID